MIVSHAEPGAPGGYAAATAISSVDSNGNNLVQLGNFNLTAAQIQEMALAATFADLIPADSDNDGIPNCQDLDSDNDGIPDNIE